MLFICDHVGFKSVDHMKRELSYRQIDDWLVFFMKKYGKKDKRQTDDQMFAAMQSVMSMTEAINGSSSKS